MVKHSIIIIVLTLLSATANAGTGFLVKEIKTNGFTKHCVYDYLGNTYIVTIQSTRICKLTIEIKNKEIIK
jgi:hypothetical protein